jgi:two-component system LytT family response regulator
MRTVLVDDERHCLKTLEWELKQTCPELEVVGTCTSGEEALELVRSTRADLVFLDIEMPGMNGFEFLGQFEHLPFEVIFTTAYDNFAIKAFKVKAADYLLKPIDSQELRAAVDTVQSRRKPEVMPETIQTLLEQLRLQSGGGNTLVSLPASDGLDFVPASSIVYCQSEGNYAHIHLQDRPKMLVTRTLRELEEQLPPGLFFRVHNSFLINLREVRRFVRNDGGYLVMSNGDAVRISRTRKEQLLNHFDKDFTG